MTIELLSTSVPSGLEPGSSGYCTVAMTRNIPRPLLEILESLSAYKPLFLPGDPRAAGNPVALSHLRVSAGAKTYSLLSRVCFSGADYSGRSNRFAHHVALEPGEPRPAGGPAWAANRPGFLLTMWDKVVRWLPAARRVPDGDASPGCPTWTRLFGDAGWAGVVAGHFLGDPSRPVYLLYASGDDLPALLAEAVAVLPADRRWQATFTTYFTSLPPGVTCQVRCVVKGSDEAAALPAASVIDLTTLRGKTPPAGNFVEAARAGRVVVLAPAAGATAKPAAAVAKSHAHDHAAEEDPPPPPDELETMDPIDRSAPRNKGGSPTRWVLIAASLVLALVAGGVGAVAVVRPDLFGRRGEHADGGKDDKEGRDDKSPPKKVSVGPLKLSVIDKIAPGTPVTATVQPPTLPHGAPRFPWRDVKLYDGKSALAAESLGEGQFRLPKLPEGSYALKAVFAGNEAFDPSESAVASLTVAKARATGFALTAEKEILVVGEKAEFRVEGLPKGAEAKAVRLQLKDAKVGDFADAKPTRSEDGSRLTLNLPSPRAVVVRAVLPDAEAYAGATSGEVTILVAKRPPVLTVTLNDKGQTSRGTVAPKAQVAAGVEGLPVPKGKLTMDVKVAGKSVKLADVRPDDKGEAVLPETRTDQFGEAELTVAFEPDAVQGLYEKATYRTTFAVIRTVRVPLRVRYSQTIGTALMFSDKLQKGRSELKFRAPGERLFLAFVPAAPAVAGVDVRQKCHTSAERAGLESWARLDVLPAVRKPGKDTKAHFPAATMFGAEVQDPGGAGDASVSFFLTLHDQRNAGAKNEDYIGKLAEFAKSLHNAEIEIYNGKGAAEKESPRTKQGDLPLLRLKLAVE